MQREQKEEEKELEAGEEEQWLWKGKVLEAFKERERSEAIGVASSSPCPPFCPGITISLYGAMGGTNDLSLPRVWLPCDWTSCDFRGS